MLKGSVVVVVAPLGSKLNNFSPACDPALLTGKLGVVFSHENDAIVAAIRN